MERETPTSNSSVPKEFNVFSRNWSNYHRKQRAYRAAAESAVHYRDSLALSRASRTQTAKKQVPAKHYTVTQAVKAGTRVATPDVVEQLRIQLRLAEEKGDVARYCNAKDALRSCGARA